MPEVPPKIAHEDRPDRRLVNRSGGRLLQRRCSWVNTCGACGQYHGKVWGGSAEVASIEVHVNCECIDIPIEPGEESFGYPSIDEIAPELSSMQQRRLMGRGNFQLWQSGKVPFEKIVTKRRIRSFAQVSSKLRPPKGILSGSPDVVERNLSNWYRDEFGLTGGNPTSAARVRMSLADQSRILGREFEATLQNFRLTEKELRLIWGKSVTNRILTGQVGLRVELEGMIGTTPTARLYSGAITIDQVASAIRTASGTGQSAEEILLKLEPPGG